jgi:hypothetical protein
VEALKLAALDHPDHNAWPVMSGVRGQLWGTLQKRLGTGDTWLHLCAIQPALMQGQVEQALKSYSRIEGDPFLSRGPRTGLAEPRSQAAVRLQLQRDWFSYFDGLIRVFLL